MREGGEKRKKRGEKEGEGRGRVVGGQKPKEILFSMFYYVNSNQFFLRRSMVRG
jgi:hypothetical protein